MNSLNCLLLYFLLDVNVRFGFAQVFWDNSSNVTFLETIYLARVVDDKLEFTNGPIILDKPELENLTFAVTSENFANFVIIPTEDSLNIILTKKPLEDYLITLDAIDQNQITVARTHVVILTKDRYDPYKLVFQSGDREYVIIDYFYYRVFSYLLIFLAAFILLLETYDIFKSKMDNKNNSNDNTICYDKLKETV